MSTPSDPTHPRRPHPAAMRYLFLFLLGLVVGIVAVVMVLRAIDARRTWQDHYPNAVMQLMQAHTAQLAATTQANRCAATDTLPHLRALRELGNDLEPAFAGLREDERFAAHAGKLRQTLDAALSSPPLDCAGASRALEQIGETCKACHQEFRG